MQECSNPFGFFQTSFGNIIHSTELIQAIQHHITQLSKYCVRKCIVQCFNKPISNVLSNTLFELLI